ncbi:MAG: sugar phosphate nucleotidyltransferase [Caldilineaceae bacterium]
MGNGRRWGVNITYISPGRTLGSRPRAVKISRDFLGDDRFVMFLGDNVIQGGINNLIREFDGSGWNNQVVLTEVDHPESYGVAELDDRGASCAWWKSRAIPQSNLALLGICSTTTSSKPSTASTRVGAANWRSPTRSSGWWTTTTRCTRTSLQLVDRYR